MVTVDTEYISVGGNRHPSAADWDSGSGLLAYGAQNNIAIWDPLSRLQRGVRALLTGHTDQVNAVKFFPRTPPSTKVLILLTASVDRTIKVWRSDDASSFQFNCVHTRSAHESSINCLATSPESNIFVSGSADATVKVWRLDSQQEIGLSLLQTLRLKPRFFPLSLAICPLGTQSSTSSMILAVAGTQSTIQIFVAADTHETRLSFEIKTTLSGHEAWIRSLAFRADKEISAGLLLASASQDKYIRIWRVHSGKPEDSSLSDNVDDNDDDVAVGQPMSNKSRHFDWLGQKYTASFEALLLGHEDWIYTAYWNPLSTRLQLLTASADTSLAIWEPDPDSGLWICVTRLGGISAQKGSTSATGSTGGFWMGLWSPKGSEVVSLGKAGSWRLWKTDKISEEWTQSFGVTGHVSAVTGITWERKGEYLLSTSSDQTTRLHAAWWRNGLRSWHELARPQIHGYDLNCIDTLDHLHFISGADEKLLRVFSEPRATAHLLTNLSGSGTHHKESVALPDAANMPVLGLSNKIIEVIDDDIPITNGHTGKFDDESFATQVHISDITLDRPPTEDQLARHTLWPEVEKLYGHGYEISTVAASNDHSVVATACKSSSIDHAVIRLYETKEWHEIKPSLKAHSLTVTSLAFSEDDNMLLSVGRDRQWTVFTRSDEDKNNYKLFASNPKGHSRMILDAAWLSVKVGSIFATSGRDKSVKIWSKSDQNFVCKSTMQTNSPATAVDFLPEIIEDGKCLLAVGEENGSISLYTISPQTLNAVGSFSFRHSMCPSRSVTKVAWRPGRKNPEDVNDEGKGDRLLSSKRFFELAVASEDSSLRLFEISGLDI